MEEKYEFIKLYFNKEPQDVEIEDINLFISQEPPESKNLEFKHPDVLRGSFDKITKTISGFANTEGGLLIIGLSEKDSPSQKAKIADEIVWYNGRMSVESLEQRIASNISPIITKLFTLVITNPTNNSERIFLINVPQSKSKPHYDALTQNYFFRLNYETRPMPHSFVELAFQRSYHPDLSLSFVITRKVSFSKSFQAFLFIYLENTGNATAEGVFITLSYNSNVDKRQMRVRIEGRPAPIFNIRKKGAHGVKYADLGIPVDSMKIHSTEDSKMIAINCQQLPMHPGLELLIARLEVVVPDVLASGNEFLISYKISAKDAKTKKGSLLLSLNTSNVIEIKQQ